MIVIPFYFKSLDCTNNLCLVFCITQAAINDKAVSSNTFSYFLRQLLASISILFACQPQHKSLCLHSSTFSNESIVLLNLSDNLIWFVKCRAARIMNKSSNCDSHKSFGSRELTKKFCKCSIIIE